MKPRRTADARIGGAMLFAESITEQVEARRALADSEARFRVTFENAPVGIGLVAPDGRWLRVNEAMCRILGYPADELVTKTFQDITHLDDLVAEVAQVEQMRDGNADKRYLRKNGATGVGDGGCQVCAQNDRSIDYIIAVIEDISARKQEEELRGTVQVVTSQLAAANRPVR
jgi:two-component system, NarL family, sensor histidine kinase UhpB